MTFFSLDEGNQNVWPRQSFSQAKKKKNLFGWGRLANVVEQPLDLRYQSCPFQ